MLPPQLARQKFKEVGIGSQLKTEERERRKKKRKAWLEVGIGSKLKTEEREGKKKQKA